MRRRDFLATGVAGAVAAAAVPGCGRSPAPDAGAPAATPASVPPFEFDEVDLAGLQQRMERGEATAEAIAEAYLARIDAIDRQGPTLGSVIELNPEALDIARALDRERRERGPRGPLHGVPILIKDNIDTADRMRTTAGSLALAEWTPPRDAFIVERLREAGVVPLGKTNLSEWANFRSTRSTSGWSARGGQTRNPYVLDRNPCGSSSGSGVAVSANLCVAAVGTETDGSVVCPAHNNGIVGIKPTVGLLSRSGIIPVSASQDTAGPMARTVADAAALLAAMVGVDPRDEATAASRPHAGRDYDVASAPDALRGARIGVVRAYFGFHDRVDAVIEQALDAMRAAGAVLIDPVEIATLKAFGDAEFEVLLYEFKAGLNAYLGGLGAAAPARSLADLIAFNETNREREMPWFGQEIFERAEAKGPLTDQAYLEALATCRRATRDEGIDRVMSAHALDALVAPTGGPAWPTDPVNGDHFLGGSSSLAAVAGYPAVTVPAGFVFGLPVGLSFFGRAWSEPVLIRLASAFERATSARRPPAFAPTLSVAP